jgi:hypothetical protein
MSLLIPAGETLMKWRESNACVRKNFSFYKIFLITLAGAIILGVVVGLKAYARDQKTFPLTTFLYLPLMLVAFLVTWFSPGAVVCLNELCIVKSGGKYGSRSDYSEIETGLIHRESYKGENFAVITFNLKDKSKFRINSPVNKIAIPENVDLSRVLQILAEKGVTIIQEKSIA